MKFLINISKCDEAMLAKLLSPLQQFQLKIALRIASLETPLQLIQFSSKFHSGGNNVHMVEKSQIYR